MVKNITVLCEKQGSILRDEAELNWISFSDGAEACKVGLPKDVNSSSKVIVQCNVVDVSKDILRIGVVKDSLDRLGLTNVSLSLPYMPHGRADRVFEQGGSFPLKMFANILNSFNFKKIYVYDPHSDVTPALVDNIEIVPQVDVYSFHRDEIESYMGKGYSLVSPDIGAAKKTFDIAKRFGNNLIQAYKVRDVTTGDIVACDVQVGEKPPKKVVIVDDISDGGASFVYLTRKLKAAGVEKVALMVTHGIFSKGLEPLKEIDYIFVDNIICEYVTLDEINNFNENSFS
jgi:ribose-phosphate pyrophosphokinase